MSTSLVLLFLTVGVAAYAWQSPTDKTAHVAVLANTKPPQEDIVNLIQDSPEPAGSIELVESLAAQQEAATATATLPTSSKPTLPEAFDKFEPTAELAETTEFGSLNFSTEVTSRYEPVDPNNIFAEGFYTIYATFEYGDMADGMEWAWVWRRNGEVLEGGNELWAYGEEGPGYIYLSPEEGFKNGEYSLDVWVNGELLTRSDMTINTAAAAAGN